MKFATARLAMLAIAAIVAVSTLVAQSTTYIVPRADNSITAAQISDIDRRVTLLESNKYDTRLVRIETLLEQAAQASESSRQTMLAILVPVGLLTLEALFRLASAWPQRKKS